MRKLKWKVAMGITAAVVVAGGAAGYAWADPTAKSTTHVDGLGDIADDFNDHEREAGVLCEGCDNSNDTDLVRLWQSILAVDAYLSVQEIDGDFGPETAEATEEWKNLHDLSPDGKVDQEAWAEADDNLSDGETRDDELVVRYRGDEDTNVKLIRNESDGGSYRLVSVEGLGGTVVNANGAEYIELFEETITLSKP